VTICNFFDAYVFILSRRLILISNPFHSSLFLSGYQFVMASKPMTWALPKCQRSTADLDLWHVILDACPHQYGLV